MTTAEALPLWGILLCCLLWEAVAGGGLILGVMCLAGASVMVFANPLVTGSDLAELAAQGAAVPLVLAVVVRFPRWAFRKLLPWG